MQSILLTATSDVYLIQPTTNLTWRPHMGFIGIQNSESFVRYIFSSIMQNFWQEEN